MFITLPVKDDLLVQIMIAISYPAPTSRALTPQQHQIAHSSAPATHLLLGQDTLCTARQTDFATRRQGQAQEAFQSWTWHNGANFWAVAGRADRAGGECNPSRPQPAHCRRPADSALRPGLQSDRKNALPGYGAAIGQCLDAPPPIVPLLPCRRWRLAALAIGGPVLWQGAALSG
jgi:hypothetical protein